MDFPRLRADIDEAKPSGVDVFHQILFRNAEPFGGVGGLHQRFVEQLAVGHVPILGSSPHVRS
jgi:hypothetical protein